MQLMCVCVYMKSGVMWFRTSCQSLEKEEVKKKKSHTNVKQERAVMNYADNLALIRLSPVRAVVAHGSQMQHICLCLHSKQCCHVITSSFRAKQTAAVPTGRPPALKKNIHGD